LATSSVAELWDTIALEAERESPLWAGALRPESERELIPVFSRLCEPRFALGLETIYEGYLVHYGRPRLFAPRDEDTGLLLGDYLYAHGLVRIADENDVGAVAELAELISVVSHRRAESGGDDGPAWAAAAGRLGHSAAASVDDDIVEDALAAHRLRVGPGVACDAGVQDHGLRP
jgi:hypothetical protein